MSDMKNQHEEEYQYPAEEHIEPKTEESVSSEAPVDETAAAEESKVTRILSFVSEKRKVLLMVLMVVAVFVAFKWMTSGHKPDAPKAKPVVHHVAPKVVQPSPEVEKQLSQLAQAANANQSAISAMQDQIQHMQGALSRASNQYEKTNATLHAIERELKKQQALQQPRSSKPVKHAKKMVPITFYLKAIVPGRAWVFSTSGLSETISVGDSLPQYGRVTGIDAKRGVVMTSSGKVIEYGVGDF